MRILQVLHDYLPEHVGGTEVHVHRLATALVARGHEVTALFAERDLAREEGALREGELDGVRTLELVHQREHAALEETWTQPRARAALEALLARERFDAVHVQHLAAFGFAALTSIRERGCALVVTVHDYHLLCDEARFLRRDGAPCPRAADPRAPCADCLLRHPPPARRDVAAAEGERRRAAALHLAGAQRVVAPSRHAAEVLARAELAAGPRVVVLGNPASGPRRPPRTPRPAEPLRAGFVGGLFPAKGAHVAVEAVRLARGAPLELDVHGPLEWFPEYVRELRRAAEGLPVRFHGRFAPRELDGVLAELDLLVVPSLWPENHPLVVADAFRRGLPVLASDLGALREHVEEGRGGLRFPAGDAGALAAHLRRLAQDRAALAALAAAAPDVLGVDEHAVAVEELYARCIAELGR